MGTWASLGVGVTDYRPILDGLDDAILVVDRSLRVVFANAEAEALLGDSAEELVGRPLAGLVVMDPPETPGSSRATFRGWTTRRGGGTLEVEVGWRPLATPDGVFAVATLHRPDPSGEGRAREELRHARAEADRVGAAKTQFLAAVSHDLRTPVNAVSLQAELLGYLVEGADPPVPVDLRDLAGDLRKAAGGLVELVNDLLDLARFDSGRIDHRPTDFAPEEWLETTLGPLRTTASTKGLALSWRVDRPGRILHADRVKLGRVLTNLVGNALKFTEAGSVAVWLGADDGGRLVLAVTDTGLGIPADQLGRIFDEFAQLRNPERDRSKGVGLGLAICRRLIETADGHLEARSQVGLGSTFTATYPADHLADVSPPPAPPVAGSPGEAIHRPTILLVEDDEGSLRPLVRLLERDGFTVEPAREGTEALAALGRCSPALMLLDLRLPGLDGPEVLRRLRSDPAHKSLPVVVLSGDVDGERLDRARSLGVAGVLAKPVDFESLKALLGRLLPHPATAASPTRPR